MNEFLQTSMSWSIAVKTSGAKTLPQWCDTSIKSNRKLPEVLLQASESWGWNPPWLHIKLTGCKSKLVILGLCCSLFSLILKLVCGVFSCISVPVFIIVVYAAWIIFPGGKCMFKWMDGWDKASFSTSNSPHVGALIHCTLLRLLFTIRILIYILYRWLYLMQNISNCKI